MVAMFEMSAIMIIYVAFDGEDIHEMTFMGLCFLHYLETFLTVLEIPDV